MDKNALAVIFDRYAVDLFNYAMHISDDPLKADSIVGDVFANFLEHLATGKGPQKNLRSYFYKATYHFMVDGSRFSARESRIGLASFVSENANGNHSKASNLDTDTILLAIKNHLTADQRDVIVLHYLEGFSLSEIAEIIGKRINNVKAIQKRAIYRLCNILDQKVSA